MGTQGPGRRRVQNQKQSAEDEALQVIAREAEARLALRRAARAEAREIRMKELEKQHKELFHSHKKYYGLDNKWGHIEQWMEDSERYSRHSRRHASMSDDEERMSVGSRGSFRPSDYSSFLGSGSRASSRSSSARASPVVEERPERDFLDKACRTSSTLSPSTLASLGGASRRGSCDTSVSVETEASIRDMKEALVEAEEKFRRSMLSNAQLHNEKEALKYQVEALKEELSATEEELWESRRQAEQSSKETVRRRQSHDVLKVELSDTRATLKATEQLLTEVTELRVKSTSYSQEVCDLQEVLQWKEKKMEVLERRSHLCDLVQVERDQLRDEVERLTDLLKKHGVVVSTNGEAEGGGVQDDVSRGSATQLAEELSHDDRESILELQQGRLLKTQLEQRDPAGGAVENGADVQHVDRTTNALKFKLVKSEQEVTTLQQHVVRLEAQVSRYKAASENSQSLEDELKVEKRRLQRELRSALHRLEEVEASNKHLLRRVEKMKASRHALLAQQ